MRKKLSILMEWVRPVGIGAVYFIAELHGVDAKSKFHILGPLVVLIMSGSVAFESLFLGVVASEKIGFEPHREYQVQSALNNLALAVTALLVFLLDWGVHADAAVVTAMLLFFSLSAANHLYAAVKHRNFKMVNLLRPALTLLLLGVLLPSLINALR